MMLHVIIVDTSYGLIEKIPVDGNKDTFETIKTI
jgi:hypothetical protein